jgi:hypothetical protein
MTMRGWRQSACKALLVVGGLVAGSLAGTAAQAGWSAGVTVEPEVTVAQVGLPAYPGAQRFRDPEATTVRWTSSSGVARWACGWWR